MDTPREYTLEEVRKKFLDAVRGIAQYWADERLVPDRTTQERCQGVAFSILVLLDGDDANLPGFALVPDPHPDDKEYCRGEGENWYPTQEVACDIRGAARLHDEFYRPPGVA